MTHFSEMREPPQNQASSTKRATIQGNWFSAASSPPTILSMAGGPKYQFRQLKYFSNPIVEDTFWINTFTCEETSTAAKI